MTSRSTTRRRRYDEAALSHADAVRERHGGDARFVHDVERGNMTVRKRWPDGRECMIAWVPLDDAHWFLRQVRKIGPRHQDPATAYGRTVWELCQRMIGARSSETSQAARFRPWRLA